MFVGITFELGQAILSSYVDGFLRVQPDGLGPEPKVGSHEVKHPLGFHSRPNDPETNPDGSAQEGAAADLLIGRDGSERFAFLLGDRRSVAGIPPLKKGSSVHYACSPLPSFFVLNGDDGTAQLYIEVGDSAHVITIGNDGNGEATLELTHARGMALTFFRDKAVLKNRTGSVYAELSDTLGTLNGNWKVTGAFDVGATSFPLVKAPALITELTAVQTALTALAAAVSGLAALGPNSSVSAAAATAATAAANALAALSAFGTAGPTTMMKGF